MCCTMIKRLFFSVVIALGMLPAKAALPYSGHTVYTNDISTEEAFKTLTVVNSNGDDNTWRYDAHEHSAICYGISSHNNDDWLLTPAFQVEAGKVYEVTFTGRAGGASQSESLGTGFGTVTGYKVYRDGNYITTVTSPSYTDTTGGEHAYNVTVVTGKGESKFSNTASITTGISSVENKTADLNAATYNTAGQRVNNSYKGIIIRKGRKIIRK